MSSNIPDKITYFGIEFFKDMKIDKKEISVKGSIFSMYDTNHDGEFSDTEWETFSDAVEQENQMRQRLIDQRNNVTIKKYNNKIEQARDKINNLMREPQKYGNIWKEFEEFVEQHPYFNQLQVIGDNEVPPDGVEIFDISALGIGYQEESGQCYQKGYFPEGVSIPEEELVKYRRFISKLKECQALSQEISAQIKDLVEEISQNILLKDLAEEGAISQTQTSYQDEQTYQRYKSRIRSPENPFWSQINALEIRQNSLIAECKKAQQGANSAANIDDLQKEIGQISDQLKQLDLASRQWFINTYGKSGNSSKQTGAGSAEELLRLAVSNNGNLSAISGSGASLSIDEKQETSISKTDKVLEVTSKDEIVQTLSDKEDAQAEVKVSGVTSKDEKVQTLSDKEDAQADKSAAEEENPLNPAFSHMYNPKSLREDALGTPQNSGIGADTSQASVNQSASSSSNGVTSNLSSSYSFGLTSIDVVQAMEKANKDSVPDGAKSMLSGDNLISSENEKIAEDNIEVIKTSESDSSDSSLTGSKDNGNNVPVISTNPTSFSGSVAGSVNYTVHADEGVDVNLHAGGNLSTSVADDSFSSNGRTDVGIEVAGKHDKASVSTSISGGLSTEGQGDKTSIHTSSPSYSADVHYSHNDEHLTIEASGSVTIQDTSNAGDGADESDSLSVTPQGNIYINYNKDKFSLSSTGSFSFTDDMTMANGSINVNAGRFNFSSSFSHTKMTMETPKLAIPEELLSLNGLQDLSNISSSTTSNTNNNFTASAGYQDGNWEASASYQLSQTNGNSSNTGNISGKWKFDRDYVEASATFTDVSSSYSIGVGSNIVHQKNASSEFSLRPEGTLGYSTGDHALTFNGSADGSIRLTKDDGTAYNFSLTESLCSRIYTDGSGSYHNNMLVLSGSVTSGHISGNLSLTHSFTYNHNASDAKDTSLTQDFLSGDFSKLDFSSPTTQSESPVNQNLTLGGGLSYHQDNLTVYVNGSVSVGQNAPSPTVTLGLNWNIGNSKKKDIK